MRSRERSPREPISDAIWERYQRLIEDLYLKNGLKLSNLMDLMREEHGLDASQAQWKKRLGKWGVQKRRHKYLLEDEDCRVENGSNTSSLDHSQIERQKSATFNIDWSHVARYGEGPTCLSRPIDEKTSSMPSCFELMTAGTLTEGVMFASNNQDNTDSWNSCDATGYEREELKIDQTDLSASQSQIWCVNDQYGDNTITKALPVATMFEDFSTFSPTRSDSTSTATSSSLSLESEVCTRIGSCDTWVDLPYKVNDLQEDDHRFFSLSHNHQGIFDLVSASIQTETAEASAATAYCYPRQIDHSVTTKDRGISSQFDTIDEYIDLSCNLMQSPSSTFPWMTVDMEAML